MLTCVFWKETGLAPMNRCSSGFTLVEILVALAVVSVGVTVLLSGFTCGLDIAQASRNQAVASSLAEEQMQILAQNPGAYEWALDKAAPGQLLKVRPKGKSDAFNSVTPPSTLPVDRKASAREENLYNRFTWTAFAKLSAPDAPYVEVTIAINWSEYGHNRVFSLTSSIPRQSIPTRTEGAA
jgi:prepilin-type N-terminal cleavage/methylation domain-containing protein